jgi:hypothetical protein
MLQGKLASPTEHVEERFARRLSRLRYETAQRSWQEDAWHSWDRFVAPV